MNQRTVSLTSPNRPQRLAVFAVIAVALALPGCLHRRLMVRSDPPGAVVFVDDYEIGTTPVSHDFTYYGTRKIRLIKDGYETLTVLQPIPAPWYEWPPIDFFSENFVPGEIRDYHTLTYRLTPQVVVPVDQLRQRGEQLRQDAHAQGVNVAGPRDVPSAQYPVRATAGPRALRLARSPADGYSSRSSRIVHASARQRRAVKKWAVLSCRLSVVGCRLPVAIKSCSGSEPGRVGPDGVGIREGRWFSTGARGVP